MTIDEFQALYRTKKDKINALSKLDDATIQEIIESTDNIQAKIFYSKFLSKKEQESLSKDKETEERYRKAYAPWTKTGVENEGL